MVIEQTSCPGVSALKSLLEGVLPPAEEGALSMHLEGCPHCQDALQELAADGTSWAGLARHLGSTPLPPEAALHDALARIAAPSNALETIHEASGNSELSLNFLDRPVEPGHLGRLDNYEILEVVGRGGMGVVLKAFDPALNRIVAIKVLSPQLGSQPSARKRFLREGQTAAGLNHENIVSIHAIGAFKGLPYLVMQYVAGVSLEEQLEKGPLPLVQTVRVAACTARGLEAAHAQGMIHRDVKPANILLESGSGRVMLTDFGLARATGDARLTQSGIVVGTPQYMAPEQARGDAVDHRADLFCLGSVLYALCTGQPPFEASSLMAVLRSVSDETPRPVREINESTPRWLAAIIARLHAKDPSERFQSAAEVADLLERHLAQLQKATIPSAVPLSVPAALPASRAGPAVPLGSRHLPAPSTRRRAFLGLTAFLVLATLGIAGFAVGRKQFRQYLAPQDKTRSLASAATSMSLNNQLGVPNTLPPGKPLLAEEHPSPSSPSIPEPKLLGGKGEVKLPEPFAQVRTGGGGRYLIFHLKMAKKLAIFDVSQMKIAHEVDAPDDVRYAAGRDKLLIVVPGQRLLQRWDLHSGKREKTVPIADERPIRLAVMGCNSEGPLMLWSDGKVQLWDVARMEPLAVKGLTLSGGPHSGFELRVSADGQTFIGWTTGITGRHYDVMHLHKGEAIYLVSPDGHSYNGHWAMPNADGSLIFRHGAGIYDGEDMKILASESFKDAVLLPTEDPRFFLAVKQEGSRDTNVVSICTSADRLPVFTTKSIEKVTGSMLYSQWGYVNGEPRIHYLPSANVLVNLPESNDRIVARSLNLIDALNESGQDYLVILSRPERHIAAGTVFTYRMDVKSKSGGLRYKIESGPEDMTVSSAGVVRWRVPERIASRQVRVILTISSASGREVQHAFDLTAVEPALGI